VYYLYYLKNYDNIILLKYKVLLGFDNVELEFESEALGAIADIGTTLTSGAIKSDKNFLIFKPSYNFVLYIILYIILNYNRIFQVFYRFRKNFLMAQSFLIGAKQLSATVFSKTIKICT